MLLMRPWAIASIIVWPLLYGAVVQKGHRSNNHLIYMDLFICKDILKKIPAIDN